MRAFAEHLPVQATAGLAMEQAEHMPDDVLERNALGHLRFDIGPQGTQQIVKKARADVVTIFILPPSMAELRSRLVRRAEDAPDVIAKRLANARDEIARYEAYDYVIINDDLDAAYQAIKAILTAERLKRARATGMGDFVEGLLKEALA